MDESILTTSAEFYLPHKPFIRKNAESSTKVRIVYDPSVWDDDQIKSFNERLEPGPNLQNPFWKILVPSRVNPIAIFWDIKETFLQISMQESCRDPLRFHWVKIRDQKQIVFKDLLD